MPAMPRQAAYTPVSASLLLNVYATEIERVVAGTFANLTNTGRPRVHVYRTSTLGVISATQTAIPWQAAQSDPRSMWNTTVSDIITIRDPGDWIFFGQLRWPASATGIRTAKILKNGIDPTVPGITQSTNNLNSVSSGEGTTLGLFLSTRLALNDIMRLNAYHNGSGTEYVQIDQGGTFFGGIWIGP